MGSRLSNRGNTFVDYLLLSLVVAGISVPLVMRFFGDPIRKSLFDNRQTLVDFLAQSPKRPVPNIWFAQERTAALKDPSVTGPQNIAEPGDLGSGPNISDPGTLPQPNVSGPGEIKGPNLKDPGSASLGGATGGPQGGASGAAGGSLSSSGELSGDFFSNQEAMTKTDNLGSTANSRSASPTSVSASGGTAPANRGEAPAGQKKDKNADDDSSQKSDSQTRRYQNEELARMAKAERASQGAFNWWLIMKILIILAIFFLLMLIILGNARKR